MNSFPEQSQQEKCFVCLFLLQQIKHEQCDLSNFRCNTIENYTALCLYICIIFCHVYVRDALFVCVLFVCAWVGCATCISCTQVRATLNVTEQWVQPTEDWGADLVNNPDKQTRRWATAVKQWQHNRQCFISGRQRIITAILPLPLCLLNILFFISSSLLTPPFVSLLSLPLFLLSFLFASLISFFLLYFFVCHSFLDITALLDFLPQLWLDHFVVTERERMGKRVSD